MLPSNDNTGCASQAFSATHDKDRRMSAYAYQTNIMNIGDGMKCIGDADHTTAMLRGSYQHLSKHRVINLAFSMLPSKLSISSPTAMMFAMDHPLDNNMMYGQTALCHHCSTNLPWLCHHYTIIYRHRKHTSSLMMKSRAFLLIANLKHSPGHWRRHSESSNSRPLHKHHEHHKHLEIDSDAKFEIDMDKFPAILETKISRNLSISILR